MNLYIYSVVTGKYDRNEVYGVVAGNEERAHYLVSYESGEVLDDCKLAAVYPVPTKEEWVQNYTEV